VLTEITRLRQFCCEPRLVYTELTAVGTKLLAVLERIQVLHQTGRQVLVFSQFVAALALLRSSLLQAGISFSYLDGSTERGARQRQIDAFQAGEQRVFLISLKAGGFGLNLTAADSVIHLDPWWNPAVEAQATDRAHRSGQQRPVTAYRYVVKGTLETRILELHERKLELADTLLEGGNAASQISAEELVELLALER
jgi:SNF2 family DNA or RNA helicase